MSEQLERSVERWAKCDPEAMSKMSQAAIYYALKDAKHDIAVLARAAYRFPETFCSSCGKALGPGNEGVSHCEDHT